MFNSEQVKRKNPGQNNMAQEGIRSKSKSQKSMQLGSYRDSLRKRLVIDEIYTMIVMLTTRGLSQVGTQSIP